LDIRVELPKEIILENLEKFHDHETVKEHFPVKKKRESFKGGVKVSPGGKISVLPTSGGPDGYLFQSPIEKKIVQARIDGYTFNKLKPYESWDSFRTEARKLWNIYFQITKPVRITRIALRYINRIEIPLPMNDFKEYVITQTMEKPTENQRLPLILDIDVFSEISFINSDEEMWNKFEKLRKFKNDVFFDSITEKTKELFI